MHTLLFLTKNTFMKKSVLSLAVIATLGVSVADSAEARTTYTRKVIKTQNSYSSWGSSYSRVNTTTTTTKRIVRKPVHHTTIVVKKPKVNITVTTKPIGKVTTVTENFTGIVQGSSQNAQATTKLEAVAGNISGNANIVVSNAMGVVDSKRSKSVNFNHEKGNINKLIVNGYELDLLPAQKNKNGATISKNGNKTLNVGHALTYAKHGNYMDNANGQATSIVFYQGQITPTSKIPTAGSATYKGIAIHSYLNAQTAQGNGSVEAKSEFNVNFDKKTISGKITPNDKNYQQINLQGKIAENKIIGNDLNGYRTMEGNFFGPNAEEISGRYDIIEPGKQFINGTFGAKK